MGDLDSRWSRETAAKTSGSESVAEMRRHSRRPRDAWRDARPLEILSEFWKRSRRVSRLCDDRSRVQTSQTGPWLSFQKSSPLFFPVRDWTLETRGEQRIPFLWATPTRECAAQAAALRRDAAARQHARPPATGTFFFATGTFFSSSLPKREPRALSFCWQVCSSSSEIV